MRRRLTNRYCPSPTPWRGAMVVVAFAISAAIGTLARAENRMAADGTTTVPRAPAPKMQFAESVFDFGQVPAGAAVKHNYVFTNTGTAPLTITGVLPTCDCTTTGKWSARLEAGKTGMIPVQFDSSGYGGAIVKSVLVTSNDPSQPKIMLVLKGVVTPPIEVSPANAFFTPAANTSASETKIIRITNHAAEPLILSPPESTNHAFAVELKAIHPGKEFELRVKTVPPFSAGTVRGFITIKTNSGQEPVIAITAIALVPKSARG